MSCINQYELDLRGCRIATIENLGATEVIRMNYLYKRNMNTIENRVLLQTAAAVAAPP